MVLGIYGAGGLGREVREIAEMKNLWSEIIYIDDYNNSDILDGCKRISFEMLCKEYNPEAIRVICAVGDPVHKKELYDRVTGKGYKLCNVIHDRCEISGSAVIGEGVIIKSGVVISVEARVENNVAIMDNTYIGHGCVVADHTHISSNATFGGDVNIGCSSFVGAGVCIKERISIGEQSIIGIGTTVVKDIPNNTVCYNEKKLVFCDNKDTDIFRR